MAEAKSETLRQVEEAFHTLIMDDDFRTDPETQTKLLRHLRKMLMKHGRQIDREIRKTAEWAEKTGRH